jgi:hypothetical protein
MNERTYIDEGKNTSDIFHQHPGVTGKGGQRNRDEKERGKKSIR